MTEASKTKKPKILVIGAASSLAGLLCEKLKSRYEITGIDIDPIEDLEAFPGEFHQIGYTKRGVSDLFRSHNFSSLIHLGRIPAASDKSKSKRYQANVPGTQNILRLGLEHGVSNFVVLSTHLIYGSNPRNHLYIREEEPSNAAIEYPVLADSVELDHEATEFLWQQRSVRTIVLRPSFIIGKHIHHPLANALRQPFCPKIMGYDPLMQLIHEDDLIQAILLALRKKKRGIYNVAGEGVIPYSDAIRLAGSQPLPVPLPVLQSASGIFKLAGWNIPPHLLDVFRFPIVVSDAAFREDFSFESRVSIAESLSEL